MNSFISTGACFDELAKMGAISDEQAQNALNRYETLERNRPTFRQVGRYGLLGAGAGVALGGIGDAIAGKPLYGGGGVKNVLRGVASKAITGALGSGAVPLVRAHLDRQAEMNTLKQYLAERTPAPPVVAEKVSSGLLLKGAAGASTRGGFLMASEVPAFRPPQLSSPVQYSEQQIVEKLGAAVTPQGRLSEAKRVGTPRVSPPPGPSVAQVSKPVGFGKPSPGALKNSI